MTPENQRLIQRLRENERARAMSRPEPSSEPPRRFTSDDIDHEKVRQAMKRCAIERYQREAEKRRRLPREYGPHDPNEGPQTVTVLLGGMTYQSRPQQTGHWPVEGEAPMPLVLREQRAAINRLAYEAGKRARGLTP